MIALFFFYEGKRLANTEYDHLIQMWGYYFFHPIPVITKVNHWFEL